MTATFVVPGLSCGAGNPAIAPSPGISNSTNAFSATSCSWAAPEGPRISGPAWW